MPKVNPSKQSATYHLAGQGDLGAKAAHSDKAVAKTHRTHGILQGVTFTSTTDFGGLGYFGYLMLRTKWRPWPGVGLI